MFNKNLRNIRLQKELSQKQVADFLNVSPQSVSKWEKGEALPSIDYLPKLAEILNCDINAFFVTDDDNVYDLELLKEFFSFMTALVCDEIKKTEEFYPFWKEHPDILDIFNVLGEDLKQYQTLKKKTIQGILNCSENDATVFLNYFFRHEFIEKMEADDCYFVIKSNIDGMSVLLKVLIEMCHLLSK